MNDSSLPKPNVVANKSVVQVHPAPNSGLPPAPVAPTIPTSNTPALSLASGRSSSGVGIPTTSPTSVSSYAGPNLASAGQLAQPITAVQTNSSGQSSTTPLARPTALSPQQRKLLQKQQSGEGVNQPLPKPQSRFSSVQSNTLPESVNSSVPTQQLVGGDAQLRATSQQVDPNTIQTVESKSRQNASPPPSNTPKFASAGFSLWRNPLILGGLGLITIFFVGALIFRLFSGGNPATTSSDQNAGIEGVGGSDGANGGSAGDGSGGGVGDNSEDRGSNQREGAQSAQPLSQPTTLTYWGLWEDNEAMQVAFSEFEKLRPGVTVNYIKQSHKSYRERLASAIASGSGPDIFRFHASWTPMLKSELSPIPSSIMSLNDFQQTFYPVALKQLQLNGQPIGIPMMYDGLVLYVNDEILQNANEKPPTTWAQLKDLATKLTIKSSSSVVRGGLAIGNATNVEHFSDILAVLMLQNGADLTNPNTSEGRDALLFYTNFMRSDQVWSSSLPSSTVAFARSDVAMMFAPSWRAHEVSALNPDLKFSTYPIPTLVDTKLSWATYWAEGVSSKSSNSALAWELLKFLSQKEVQQALHASQSNQRGFGEPHSRMDLANELGAHPVLAAVLEDAPHAQGWHMSSYTHDNGINDQIIKYYENAITSILSGTSTEDALNTLDKGVKQVLKQYGVD